MALRQLPDLLVGHATHERHQLRLLRARERLRVEEQLGAVRDEQLREALVALAARVGERNWC